MGEEELSRYGFPAVGQIVDALAVGARVVTRVTDKHVYLSKQLHFELRSWGYFLWPKGMTPLSRCPSGDPIPAWGRKGPIVPPMVGMVVEIEQRQYRVKEVSDDFIVLDEGFGLQRASWVDAGLHIVKLPDDFTWPLKEGPKPREIDYYAATLETVVAASGALSGDLSGPYPSSRAALTVTAQPSLPTLIALPSLFLLIGDCRVEFRRDGAILVNDRPVGSDRETCELFAEFARVQSQGGDGEVSFDREKILATLHENERLRERIAGLEAQCRRFEGVLAEGRNR